jgi:hypothetical protein
VLFPAEIAIAAGAGYIGANEEIERQILFSIGIGIGIGAGARIFSI